jgi:Skp family chaperone for outer membrane proteins
LLFITGLISASFSAPLNSIGYIEVQRVFKGYKETMKAQEKLSKEEAVFKKEFEESQKKLESAKSAKKSQKEVDTITKELEEKLAPKREVLMKLNEELTTKLQKDIIGAVSQVAKNLGLDTVLDKQAVIVGGVDISDMVINKLNEKK